MSRNPVDRVYRAVRRRAGRARAAADQAISAVRLRLVRGRVLIRDDGPGGPILVVVDDAGFSRYLVEILRAEGLNSFRALPRAEVSAAVLAQHDVVLLGAGSLDASTADELTTWVAQGGNLVAIRPDRRLAGVFGLEPLDAGGDDRYLLVDTTRPPGAGICDRPMQIHGGVDRYRLAGAQAVAELCDEAGRPTGSPAVTMGSLGGGHAAAFLYDLPRSIVYTRQGNPAWAGQNRDGDLLTRSNDLFFGAAEGDPQPDWVDRALFDVPQADEQQRLLIQLIQHVNAERRAMPRFWYLPRELRAAIVMTGDDHALNGTAERFAAYAALDRPDADPGDWTGVRATSYMFADASLTDAEVANLEAAGFEISAHVSVGLQEWTRSSLASAYRRQLASFRRAWPSVAAPVSHRTHAVVWSDWSSQPEIERSHGIRLDTNYYLYPPPWARGQTGFFTGSALPMRFASRTGEVIDCYQTATLLTDESEQIFPDAIEHTLDRALRPPGHVAIVTANMHTDLAASIGSDAIVAAARRRSVPIVSARQLLTWLDARAASSIGPAERVGERLRFSVVADERARHLTVLVPLPQDARSARRVSCDGAVVEHGYELIGGVLHVVFPVKTGVCEIDLSSEDPTPAIVDVEVTATSSHTAAIAWRSSRPSAGRVTLEPLDGTAPRVIDEDRAGTRHAIDVEDLTPGARYRVRIDGVEDRAGHELAVPNEPAVHDSIDAFLRGTCDGTIVSGARGGCIALAPQLSLEPGVDRGRHDGWESVGGTIVSSRPMPSGSFEVEAVLPGEGGHRIGVAADRDRAPSVAFVTEPDGGLSARITAGLTSLATPVPGRWDTAPHRLRIDWDAGSAAFAIDGRAVAAHRVPLDQPLRALVDGIDDASGGVRVLWARTSDFCRSGTYTSPPIDNGRVAGWGRVTVTAPALSMTGARISVRIGDAPAPDGTWSEWTLLGPAGEPVGGRSRYLQYRLELLTASPLWTPEVTAVTVERLA